MNWAQIEADLEKVRLDNESMVALRRGNDTLAEQSMRVEIAGARGFRVFSDAAREARQAVVILGAKDLDIAVDDRFTLGGQLYRVAFVQPNREAATIAEAVVVG